MDIPSVSRLRKAFRTRNIIIVVLLVGGYYAYGAYFGASTTTSSGTGTITTIGTGTIRATIKGLGKTTLVNDQSIRFTQAGTVAAVHAKEGDKVKQGDLIAELDQNDLNNQIQQAETNLSSSQIALQSLINGTEESQKLKAQNTVTADQHKIEGLQTDLANLQKQKSDALQTLQNTIDEQTLSQDSAQKDATNIRTSDSASVTAARQDLANAQNNLAIAQKDLANAQLSESQNLHSAGGSYENKVRTATIEVQNALIDADTLLSAVNTTLALDDPSRSAIIRSILGSSDTLDGIVSSYGSLRSEQASLRQMSSSLLGMTPASVDRTTLTDDLQKVLDYTGRLVTLTDTLYGVLDQSMTATIPSTSITDADVAGANNALITAMKSLQDTRILEGQTVSSAGGSYESKMTNAANEIRNMLIDAGNTLDSVDTVLGITDKYKSAAYHNIIGVTDAQDKLAATNLFGQLTTKKASLQAMSDHLQSIDVTTMDRTTLAGDLQSTFDFANQLVTITSETYNVLTNTTADSTNLPSSQLSSLTSTVSGARSNAQSHVSSLTTHITNIQTLEDAGVTQTRSTGNITSAIQAVRTAEGSLRSGIASQRSNAQSHVSSITSRITDVQTLEDPTLTVSTSNINMAKKTQAVKDAETTLTKAQNTLTNLLASLPVNEQTKDIASIKAIHSLADSQSQLDTQTATYDAQIAAKEKDIEDAKKQLVADQTALQETLRGPTDDNIQKAKNDIAMKELSLSQTKENVKNYEIRAPFDGTIRQIDFKVGDNLASDSSSTVEYVYIQNPDLVQVDVLLDQNDIVKVKP